MTNLQMRTEAVTVFNQAVAAGARRKQASEVLGVTLRTLQRWQPKSGSGVASDQRGCAVRPAPANKLTAEECQRIIAIANAKEYASLPPSQIVPKLADSGIYIASESTFYRVLSKHNMLHHRGVSRPSTPSRVVTTHLATAIKQVWMWDITWLPSNVKGKYYYLYQVIDLYSRYGVAWEIHEVESGDLAAALMERAVLREKTQLNAEPLVLHSDNGSAMKSKTLSVKLAALGVTKSHSRPRVSDDNAYIESFFRTLKYCPRYPSGGFESVEIARQWMQSFMHWYNHEHQHSKISFVTPAQRHTGQDVAILARRKALYAAAKTTHPNRWSGDTRNWEYIPVVALNPEAKIHLKTDQAA